MMNPRYPSGVSERSFYNFWNSVSKLKWDTLCARVRVRACVRACVCMCVCVCNLNRIVIFNIFVRSFVLIVCFEILNCLDALMLTWNILSISYYDFHALLFHDHQILSFQLNKLLYHVFSYEYNLIQSLYRFYYPIFSFI